MITEIGFKLGHFSNCYHGFTICPPHSLGAQPLSPGTMASTKVHMFNMLEGGSDRGDRRLDWKATDASSAILY